MFLFFNPFQNVRKEWDTMGVCDIYDVKLADMRENCCIFMHISDLNYCSTDIDNPKPGDSIESVVECLKTCHDLIEVVIFSGNVIDENDKEKWTKKLQAFGINPARIFFWPEKIDVKSAAGFNPFIAARRETSNLSAAEYCRGGKKKQDQDQEDLELVFRILLQGYLFVRLGKAIVPESEKSTFSFPDEVTEMVLTPLYWQPVMSKTQLDDRLKVVCQQEGLMEKDENHSGGCINFASFPQCLEQAINNESSAEKLVDWFNTYGSRKNE